MRALSDKCLFALLCSCMSFDWDKSEPLIAQLWIMTAFLLFSQDEKFQKQLLRHLIFALLSHLRYIRGLYIILKT